MHAVTVSGRLVALELEADERPLRMCPPLRQGLLADEVLLLVRRDGEPDAGLERVDLVVELDAGEGKTRLDAEHVERLETEGRQAVRLAGRQDGIPQRRGVLRMAEQLVAQLARVARP